MDNLQRAIQEAKRFLEKAEELERWRERTNSDPSTWWGDPVHRRLNAALKRASLDLTKALPVLRR